MAAICVQPSSLSDPLQYAYMASSKCAVHNGDLYRIQTIIRDANGNICVIQIRIIILFENNE